MLWLVSLCVFFVEMCNEMKFECLKILSGEESVV